MVYDKNTWASGDTITSEKLNNMETGIDLANSVDINFTFTETPGMATVDKTLSDVQTAHDAGRRVYLHGMMDGGAIVHVEVTGFVYYEGDLVAWTATVTASGVSGPTGVYLVQGFDDSALFAFIPVS